MNLAVYEKCHNVPDWFKKCLLISAKVQKISIMTINQDAILSFQFNFVDIQTKNEFLDKW